MFQTSFFPSQGINIYHPPEVSVTPDLLFETELLFVWNELMDPHLVKKQLGRYVPFVHGVVHDHQREIGAKWEELEYSLREQKGHIVSGIILIGLLANEFEILDKYVRTPIHHRRDKVKCHIGSLERTAHLYIQRGALLE